MLKDRFDKQDKTLEDINSQIKQNNLMITKASKAFEFNAAEIKESKTKSAYLEKKASLLLKDNKEVKTNPIELEYYKSRWNLCINGMKKHFVSTSLHLVYIQTWADQATYLFQSKSINWN